MTTFPLSHGFDALGWIIYLVPLVALFIWGAGKYGKSTPRGKRTLLGIGAILVLPVLIGVAASLVGGVNADLHQVRRSDVVLGHAGTFNGVSFPAGTAIVFEQDSMPGGIKRVKEAAFQAPHSVGNVSVEGTAYFGYSETSNEAHLREAHLASDQIIDGIPCKGGTYAHFEWTAPRVTSCILAQTFMSNGAACPADAKFTVANAACDRNP